MWHLLKAITTSPSTQFVCYWLWVLGLFAAGLTIICDVLFAVVELQRDRLPRGWRENAHILRVIGRVRPIRRMTRMGIPTACALFAGLILGRWSVKLEGYDLVKYDRIHVLKRVDDYKFKVQSIDPVTGVALGNPHWPIYCENGPRVPFIEGETVDTWVMPMGECQLIYGQHVGWQSVRDQLGKIIITSVGGEQ